ncbi:MAG: Acetolactate synthase isozyme 2 large subunit [Alphaproteobacteria bacterium MarineAlpha12_Bin1]|nr:MAG: Acetolactate synthase isozyme 2 large subunit [Alphaproteobacteria bacterium MarineAlpha12_Bin1]
MKRTGGQILVQALKIHGVDTVFCVPGESYLAVIDSLSDAEDEIRVITCRHENGAAFMGEAYGKLTGNPGVTFVTRGPGACNGSIGVHTAMQDSSPMIMFVGQVPKEFRKREAFQEVDYESMFAPLAKWVVEVNDAALLPQIISEAFSRSTSGRPGPVIVSLPEDILTDEVEVNDLLKFDKVITRPDNVKITNFFNLLSKSQKPLVIVGGGGWSDHTSKELITFATKNNLPVASSFRAVDIFNNNHPNYVGEIGIGANPNLAQRVREADLLIVIGARLGEITTQGYTLISPPKPKQSLVHVYPDVKELGRVYRPDLGINSDVESFIKVVSNREALEKIVWDEWTTDARKDFKSWVEPKSVPGDLNLGKIFNSLRDLVPDDTIFTSDAGNFAGWAGRYLPFHSYRTFLGATNGAMGYGLPAAVSAKVACPDATVICYVGDGGILMTGNELATAVHHDLKVIVIIANNSMYGTIRMHQEREYPGRKFATDLSNPDFVGWAQSFGVEGERVEETRQFEPALKRALKNTGPTVIEILVSQELLSTNMTLTEIRESIKPS